MNTQNINLFSVINEAETKKLTTVISETLAFDLNQVKTFTAADLWNIQRQRRSNIQRRHFA
jgi:hypothetical protein